MNLRTRIVLIAASLVLTTQPTIAAAPPAKADTVNKQLPQVSGPIPVTAQSRPFLGAPSAIEAS